ncbi:MAG: DUF4440 domain-containing protein [Plesiomonas sp.]|uniref:DUF4440 domain-containing protein n=1 Tax=Plesiomonas sp. TaxID=2486279 RepID=UPI003EE7E146
MNRYFQEVLDAHVLIGRWLGDTNTPQEICEQLLTRFSQNYTMVTPYGQQLDNTALNTFFRTQRGTKAGLEISIENMQLVTQSETGAIVTYQERQQRSGHNVSLRYSTAVFELDKAGNISWRHLHETALT